jgi:heavy metal sensor kinase
LDDQHRWRIVAQRVSGPEGDLVVQVARSLRDYAHEMAKLLFVLLLIGPLTVALALAGGYWLARRALAPVDQMQSSADLINAQRLNERVPVQNPSDELGRLARTINAMLDRLERTFQEMQRFTSDASHELRTPLAVIRTEAEIALQRGFSDESKQELLGTILEECQRLTWITDQLLTLSREDAGFSKTVSEPVDFSAVTRAVTENMRVVADTRQQRLSVVVDNGAIVSGDPLRLRHVVYNLLANAIKYTPPAGSIELRLTTNGEAVQLTVCDSGIGISSEHLTHVFERFYRVDKSRNRTEGGAGLGLSIVQSIVQAHGGTVELQSELGRGTSCTIRLPRTQLE